MAEQDKPYVADLPTLEIEGYPDLRISAPGNGGGSRGGWGLTTGSRRGEGGSGRFTGPAIPGFKGVIIEEHVAQNENVDNQYAPRYSNLDETIQAQISDVRTRASSAATTSTQRVEAEYAGVIDFIAQKNHEYHQQSTLANSFWGTSPLYKPSFFLAHSAQEAVKRGPMRRRPALPRCPSSRPWAVAPFRLAQRRIAHCSRLFALLFQRCESLPWQAGRPCSLP